HERAVRRGEVEGQAAQEVGAPGRLDLHDLGAQVAQRAAQLRADGADAEAHDAKAGERRAGIDSVGGRRMPARREVAAVLAGRGHRTREDGRGCGETAREWRNRRATEMWKSGLAEEVAHTRLLRVDELLEMMDGRDREPQSQAVCDDLVAAPLRERRSG